MKLESSFFEMLHIAAALKFVVKNYDLFTKDMTTMNVVPHNHLFSRAPTEKEVLDMKENFEQWIAQIEKNILELIKEDKESSAEIEAVLNKLKNIVKQYNG